MFAGWTRSPTELRRTVVFVPEHQNPYPVKCQLPEGATRCDGVGHQPNRHGCGFFFDEHTNTARDCECRASFSAWRHHHRLGGDIPVMYKDARWVSSRLQLIDQRYLKACQQFEQNLAANLANGEGLWIMGAPEHRARGAFKQEAVARNEIASIIARTCITQARSVAYYTPDQLLACMRQGRDEDLDVVAALKEIDLLVLANLDWITVPSRTFDDDTATDIEHEALDRGDYPYVFQVEGWGHDQLFDLITSRYDNCKSVIVTTRMLDPERLSEQLGDQLVSRLSASCSTVPLFDWTDDDNMTRLEPR